MGPKVCLMNEFSASDGDLFPYRFRHHKLGKLIGKRSWGGVIGIRGTLAVPGRRLARSARVLALTASTARPGSSRTSASTPDIIVDNDPGREFAGIDDQLNRGIEVILEELRTQEKTIAADSAVSEAVRFSNRNSWA